jgi:hypothetical protein
VFEFLQTAEKAGRLVVTPDKQSSFNTVLHAAFFKVAVAGQGSDRLSIPARLAVFHRSFCNRYLEHAKSFIYGRFGNDATLPLIASF